MAESRAALLGLVLDARDTFVTRVTVEAFLRRDDAAGLGVVAEPLASETDLQHETQISDAVNAVFILLTSQRDHAIDVCLALNTDEHLRHGASQLRRMLMEVHSLLEPEADSGWGTIGARSLAPRRTRFRRRPRAPDAIRAGCWACAYGVSLSRLAGGSEWAPFGSMIEER